FGTESYILTGYFNLAKVFELTLNNGTDPRSREFIGIKTGSLESFESFEMLMAAFKRQLNHFVDIKIKGNNIIARIYSRYMPVPFLSLLIDDCIEKGTDYNDGGARYNTRYIQGVGIGSLTDSLTSIKYHVFEKGHFTLDELDKILKADFEGYDSAQKMFLEESPKYGNDNDYADDIMRSVFDMFFEAVDNRPAGIGGVHRINMLPTTCHVYFGSVIGALPDGRNACKPLSEGISPVQGADHQGPTSVVKS
ncbi:MAG: formate C-acetyltransferase/glycerol dehydratase family glycyl radical enzyme, partial [bacterium]|nr:formate C-acetyltransferase/glycerol dehydratase family glycyl radical enzyme [bacterium]